MNDLNDMNRRRCGVTFVSVARLSNYEHRSTTTHTYDNAQTHTRVSTSLISCVRAPTKIRT